MNEFGGTMIQHLGAFVGYLEGITTGSTILQVDTNTIYRLVGLAFIIALAFAIAGILFLPFIAFLSECSEFPGVTFITLFALSVGSALWLILKIVYLS